MNQNESTRNEIGDVVQPPPRYCWHCRKKLMLRTRGTRQQLACPDGHFVHRENPVPVSVILIPTFNNGLILIRRKDDPSYLWLPGGYVDKGEHPRDAAIREAKEETQLDITIKECLGFEVPKDENVIAFFFLSNPVSGFPIASDDVLTAAVYFKDDPRAFECIYTKRYIEHYFQGV